LLANLSCMFPALEIRMMTEKINVLTLRLDELQCKLEQRCALQEGVSEDRSEIDAMTEKPDALTLHALHDKVSDKCHMIDAMAGQINSVSLCLEELQHQHEFEQLQAQHEINGLKAQMNRMSEMGKASSAETLSTPIPGRQHRSHKSRDRELCQPHSSKKVGGELPLKEPPAVHGHKFTSTAVQRSTEISGFEITGIYCSKHRGVDTGKSQEGNAEQVSKCQRL